MDRTRATWNTLPFKKIPTIIIIEMATVSAIWINMLPTTYGISTTIRLINIFTGLKINYKKYLWIEFGYYNQTHEYHDNFMGSRKIGAITLTRGKLFIYPRHRQTYSSPPME